MPMPAAVAATVDVDPERPAITLDDRTVSRQELLDRATAIALALRDGGVREGDLVAILLPNEPDYLAAALGALMLASTPLPLSMRLAPAELDEILELAQPATVVVPAGTRPLGRPVLTLDEVTAAPGEPPQEFLEAVAPAWAAPLTGGSTGRPKVVVPNDPATIDPDHPSLTEELRLPRDGCVVIPGPLHHRAPFAVAITALLLGNHVVLSPRFDARTTLAQIERHRASFVLLVPTMMSRILALPAGVRDGYDLSTVATVLHTAAACPAAVKEGWMAWLGDDVIYEIYGGTESVTYTAIGGTAWRRHRGSVGRPSAGDVRIVTETGGEAAPNTVGEIQLRPPTGADYPSRIIGDQAKLTADGWISLGDLGWMDEDGYLYIADRRSDLIIRGGANVYPAEVEAAIQEHPLVNEAVVVGIPDEDLGQAVHAVVNADREVSGEELAAFLSDRLSPYKLPRTYEFVAAPLRDESGKVRRSAVRERVLSSRGVPAPGP